MFAAWLVLARKLNIPVFMTGATHQAWARVSARRERRVAPNSPGWNSFLPGRSFQIGDIEVTPFTIPHDAADPVGFTFRAEGVKDRLCHRSGLHPGQRARPVARLRCAGLESNHDVEMLRVGPYPWSVKQRVMSRVGHLSNDGARGILCQRL